MFMLTFLSHFILVKHARPKNLPFALPSSSKIFRQVVDAYMNTYRLSYFSVPSNFWVISKLKHALCVLKIPPDSIRDCSVRSALIEL